MGLRVGADLKVKRDLMEYENVNFTYKRYISPANKQKNNAVHLLDNINIKDN